VSTRTGERAAAADALTALERETLLRVARESIAGHFAGRRAETPSVRGALGEARGAFVTLHRRDDGELRGCIGTMLPDRPLVEAVARMAVAAATEDRRFLPVTADELEALAIEISALGPLRPIRAQDVEVGRHGLMIGYEGRRGVLLPQVPVEHGWDRETFLGHTCRKAGLPEGTWRKPGVELLAFTADVFGED
jgi:AmmeMemoRadiSam system protein A